MVDFIILEEDDDSPDRDENYPPIGTPDACLGLSLDGDATFTILGHTGRFFHAQCNCAGFWGEEVGIDFPDFIGYFVLEKGVTWNTIDWESGEVDDYGINGDIRPAELKDFIHFNVDIPHCLKVLEREGIT